jgi:hypothetical protein
VAISKLGRLSPEDVADILVLLQDPAASWDEFERLAAEASQYYVGRDITGTIAYVKLQWQRRHGNDASSEDVGEIAQQGCVLTTNTLFILRKRSGTTICGLT